jgi:hypothetical protein
MGNSRPLNLAASLVIIGESIYLMPSGIVAEGPFVVLVLVLLLNNCFFY